MDELVRGVWLKGVKQKYSNERIHSSNTSRFPKKKHRIRCLTVWYLEDVRNIELEFHAGSVVLFSMKEISVQGHHIFKRFLQQVNALAREYNYQLIRFSREYIMGIPLDSHVLITDPVDEEE